MKNLADLKSPTFADLLNPTGLDCTCGKRHAAPLSAVQVGPGVIDRLPETAKNLGMRRPALVADRNTWAAAGEKAFALLEKAGLAPVRCLLESGRPEADEGWLGMVAAAYTPAWDGVISVGSGTVGDLSKIVAGIAKLPLINLGTAPSMDGFASTSASMLLRGVKRSVPCPCPNAILADTDIMAKAPKRMLLAGLGDMLAKYISLCEWRISNLVTGEYYCPEVAALVRDSLARCRAAAPGLAQADPAAVAETASGLILSGIAMSFAGVTRPASGVEHYFSHVWEMQAVQAGKTPELHGIQVGVGVALTLPLYARLRQERPNPAAARAHWAGFDADAYLADIQRELYLSPEAAERQLKWIRDDSEARLEATVQNWDGILAIIDEELPDAGELEALYRETGLPATPGELGVTPATARQTFIRTKDFREKYILSTLLSDLGLLECYADGLAQSLA